MAASPVFMDHPYLCGGSSADSRSHSGSSSPSSFLSQEDDETMFLQEDDTCFLLSVEMPGVNGHDLEVSLVDTTLIIGGYRRSGDSSSTRKRQRIRRTLEVDPEVIDVDRAIARVWNGCLTLYAPKKPKHGSSSATSSCIIMDEDLAAEPLEDTFSAAEWDHPLHF
ncbi:molecular chaperone small heat shock protein [Nitzschia inconspicua]|uniref:Molecular chaperone small heat shock protein n=1 Tax=Nitzschia inconspicua TaxID=303405 RepID=A0A9K3Q830_9STRA|nr:molecular chaperone small heat shock protein [Nitzschia inconspicua]